MTYFAADKIMDFGKKCIDMASDVEEMQNKFNVVFQGMTDEVGKWADEYASAIGRNSNTIKGYLADNQNMFVGMGMTREEGAKLSEQMVSLALDLASFNNLNETDAVNALSKALMGETESAKQLGAVLNDNTRAMAMEQLGYEGKFDALTEAEKMEVNYQAVLMQSADAVGDCERSLDSYKGKTIQLQSAKENLFETIGTMLLPIMTEFVGVMVEVVTWVQSAVEWAKEHETAITLLAIAVGTITTAIIAYNVAVNATTIATTLATGASSAFGAVMAFITSPITAVIAVIGLLVAAGVALYKNWDEVKAVATELWNGIKNVFNKIKDTISNTMEKSANVVKSAIDKIKGFFNFKWELPKLKMPHFTIKGGFSINPPSVPSFGVDWYAKAMNNPMIMNSPTAFGINNLGQIKVGGEAGSEVVSGTDTLMNMIQEAVAKENSGISEKLERLINFLFAILPQILDNMGNDIVLDDGVLVGRMAPAMDVELGRIASRKERL